MRFPSAHSGTSLHSIFSASHLLEMVEVRVNTVFMEVRIMMTGFDSVLDVKCLLEEALTIPSSKLILKYFPEPKVVNEPGNETTLKDLTSDTTLSFMMKTQDKDDIQKLVGLRELQDKVKHGDGIPILQERIAIRREFICLVFQTHLFGVDEPKGSDEVHPQASSSQEQPSFQWLQDQIQKLEGENEALMTSVKQNKGLISDYKKMLKETGITVNLQMLSGRSFQVSTKSGKTIKQFRNEDLYSIFGANEHEYALVVNGAIMGNPKRLHTYGISNGSFIDLVRANNADEQGVEPVEPLNEALFTQEAQTAPKEQPMSVKLNGETDGDKELIIVIPREEGEVRASFYFSKFTEASTLFSCLNEFMEMPNSDGYSLQWAGSNSKVERFDIIASYFGHKDMVNLVPKLCGGVLTSRLKRDESLKRLKLRVQDKVSEKFKRDYKNVGIPFDQQPPPEEIADFVQQFNEDMSKLKVLRAEGIPVIKLGLSKLSLEQLQQILSVANASLRNENEEKLMMLVSIIYPKISVVDCAIESLKEAKMEALKDMLGVFAEEYNVFNEVQCSSQLGIKQLKSDVEAEMSKKQGTITQEQVNACCVC